MHSLHSRLMGLFLVLLSGLATIASGAEKYTVGEDVEVFFLNEWRPAVVQDSNKKGVLCAYEFAGAPQEKVFNYEEVRHLFEAGAIARARTWSDATGKYTVRGALLKISGGKVELRTSEMKEVKIAIDKLAPKDQAYVKQFQSKAGLAAVPVPSLPTVDEFSIGTAVVTSGMGRRWDAREAAATAEAKLALAADPIRKGLTLKQVGVGFPASSHHEKLSSLIALGGNDNWVLASIGEDEKQPTRLLWVAMNKNAVKRIQMLPAGEMLIDYHASSRQLLTYSKRKTGLLSTDEHPTLTVWKTDPALEEPAAVVSWNARQPNDKSWHHAVPWSRFANGELVVQRADNHRVMGWDIKNRALAWETAQESFFAPEPRLSAGGKYVLIPEDGGLRIVDAASGNNAGQVPMDGCSGVAAHPDGKRLAVLNNSKIFIVDITGSEATRELEATSVGTPFSANFDWVGDELLAFDGLGSGSIVLFSLKLDLPIWTYNLDASAYWGTGLWGARKRSIVNDHLVYAATFDVGSKHGLAVGAVSLPGKKAAEVISTARREDFMVIRPGAKFRVEVNALDHASEIRQALIKEIAANGWFYDDNATNVIQATYKRGEARQIQYEMRGFRTGGSQTQTASITPYISELKIKVGADDAWSAMSSSGPPPIVSMREGESLQSEVDRGNSPTWEFFFTVDIPPEIIDPKKRGGVGQTAVTNRGLIEN